MEFKHQSLQPILDVFSNNLELSPTEIAQKIGKTKVIVHKYLKELVKQWKLEKVGLGTHVKYRSLIQNDQGTRIYGKFNIVIPYSQAQIIQDTFYKFSESAKLLEWVEGFIQWCHLRKLDVLEKAGQYAKVFNHIEGIRNKCGVIETTGVFANNVETMYLDEVYYADQYNRMEFGRGKLAEMTFFAKQSQNIRLINQCLALIKLKIQCIIQSENIKAIAIVPPSITRNNQLLKILKNQLTYIWLPFVSIDKYFPNRIPIPQKSLKTREQRTRNARDTIIVHEKKVWDYDKVLLIDDFVWSGSTLNETAHKLKVAGIKKIIWFAFVGNANLSYDVINEV